jgi:hypothetical protein
MLKGKERYYGLDLIRFISFIPIAMHHISLIYFYTPTIEMAKTSVIVRMVDIICRSLAFSGFTIVFISSMMVSFSQSSLASRAKLLLLLSLGWIGLSSLMNPSYDLFLAWDIYPLLLVGFCVMFLAERIGLKSIYALGTLGFILLWIPFWEFAVYFEDYSLNFRNVLGFADCSLEIAEWPILPWIGLIFSGYAAGSLVKNAHQQGKGEGLFNFSRQEMLLWGTLLVASLPNLGAFYNIELGRNFSCDAYRRTPVEFWAHFVWVIFAVRLSLNSKIQSRLAGSKVVKWISATAICRKFWLAYMINYMLCHFIIGTIPRFVLENYPHLYSTIEQPVTEFLAVFFVPITELVTRRILVNYNELRPHLKWPKRVMTHK